MAQFARRVLVDLNVAMARQGMRGRTLCRLSGIHETDLSKIRNGGRVPTPHERTAICGALGMSQEQVFGGAVTTAGRGRDERFSRAKLIASTKPPTGSVAQVQHPRLRVRAKEGMPR